MTTKIDHTTIQSRHKKSTIKRKITSQVLPSKLPIEINWDKYNVSLPIYINNRISTVIIHAHPHEIIYNVLNNDAAQFPPSKRAEVKQCRDKAPINMHAITGLANYNHTVKSNLENSPTIVAYDSDSR